MKRMLFNATYQEELRVATVDGQKLIDFNIETSSKTQRRGNIYKGIVTRLEPSLEACFVDYGNEKQGFLPFKDITANYLPEHTRPRDFSKLREGTEFIVQVEKDERGNKGAALTTCISLPGRYLVLMPNSSKSGGISRRIDSEERNELKNALAQIVVPEGMSIIARTAALGRVQEELQWDLNYLCNLWDAITTAANTHHGSFLIYQESSLVIRSIRDHFTPDISEVLIDRQDIFDQAKQFMAHVMPSFVERVKYYHDDIPLFSRFQIEHQIESAYGRIINLPSGGSIAIDHTEALTAIDVNSAKANKGSDIEATALSTNMEAADEIARQLRLRDLGGLIVVDFIDMENSRNQREVENYFKQQLALDRARIQMGKLSKFGLLELSRQRLQTSLEESTTITCPRCSGIGIIRGTESTAIHVMRIIQEEVVKNINYLSALHVQLPVAVATYLLNEKRDDIAKIEMRMKLKIVLIPNVHLESPNYRIRKITSDNCENVAGVASYNLTDHLEETQINYQSSVSAPMNKALVKNITPSHPAPIVSPRPHLGVFVNKVVRLLKSPFIRKFLAPNIPATLPNKQIDNDSKVVNRPNKSKGIQQNRDNVKTSQNAAKVVPTKSPSVKKSESLMVEKNNSANPNGKTSSTTNKVEAPNKQVQQNTKSVVDSKSESRANHQKSKEKKNGRDQSKKPTMINQEWQAPVIKSELSASAIATNLKVSSPITTIEKHTDVAVPVEVPSVKKELPVNTIMQRVDLGELEMIATQQNFVEAEPMLRDEAQKVNARRFNDVVIEDSPKIDVNAINYELVETRR